MRVRVSLFTGFTYQRPCPDHYQGVTRPVVMSSLPRVLRKSGGAAGARRVGDDRVVLEVAQPIRGETRGNVCGVR